MDKQYSATIAQVIYSYLSESNITFDFHEEKGIFSFPVRINGPMQSVIVKIDVQDRFFKTYAISNIRPDINDAEVTAQLALFFSKINFNRVLGNFQFEPETGDIRAYVFENCTYAQPDQDMAAESLYNCVQMMEEYGTGILEIIFGKNSAKEDSPVRDLYH